jgi:hypothetical protein
MATTTWRIGEYAREISMIVECSNSKCKLDDAHCETMNTSDVMYDDNLLEISLDIDEFQDLCSMATRPC